MMFQDMSRLTSLMACMMVRTGDEVINGWVSIGPIILPSGTYWSVLPKLDHGAQSTDFRVLGNGPTLFQMVERGWVELGPT